MTIKTYTFLLENLNAAHTVSDWPLTHYTLTVKAFKKRTINCRNIYVRETGKQIRRLDPQILGGPCTLYD